jgi:lycopene cyclase CruP
MFQKAMSVRMGQPFVDRRFVNRLLATNFEAMHSMGDRTLKPFLQDVVRFDGLVASLGKSFVADPTFMPQIVGWVGVPTLVDWVGHVGMMGLYAGLDNFLTPLLRPVADATLRNEEARYRLHRQMDAWRYGSGNDYDMTSIPKS